MAQLRRHRRAFTLIELLVVIFVMAIMMALLLPAVQQAREAARKTECRNTLKQWGIALNNYHDAHQVFPMGKSRIRHWSFRAMTLPFLEQHALHKRIDFEHVPHCFDFVVNAGAANPADDPLGLYFCPSDINVNRKFSGFLGDHMPGDYLGVSGGRTANSRNGLFYPGSRVSFGSIYDGSSNTLAMGERGIPDAGDVGWMLCGSNDDAFLSMRIGLAPGRPDGDHNDHFWSYHPGGAIFLTVDGAVRLISYDTDYNVMVSLATRNGEEEISDY